MDDALQPLPYVQDSLSNEFKYRDVFLSIFVERLQNTTRCQESNNCHVRGCIGKVATWTDPTYTACHDIQVTENRQKSVYLAVSAHVEVGRMAFYAAYRRPMPKA